MKVGGWHVAKQRGIRASDRDCTWKQCAACASVSTAYAPILAQGELGRKILFFIFSEIGLGYLQFACNDFNFRGFDGFLHRPWHLILQYRIVDKDDRFIGCYCEAIGLPTDCQMAFLFHTDLSSEHFSESITFDWRYEPARESSQEPLFNDRLRI